MGERLAIARGAGVRFEALYFSTGPVVQASLGQLTANARLHVPGSTEPATAKELEAACAVALGELIDHARKQCVAFTKLHVALSALEED